LKAHLATAVVPVEGRQRKVGLKSYYEQEE